MPNATTFNFMIEMYMQENDIDKVLHLMAEMKKHKIVPTTSTHGLVLRTFYSTGDCMGGIEYITTLVKSGQVTDPKILEPAMYLCATTRNYDLAMTIFSHVKKDKPFLVRPNFYKKLLSICELHKQAKTALDVLNFMNETNFQMNYVIIYQMVIQMSIAEGLVEDVKKLLLEVDNKSIRLDVSVYERAAGLFRRLQKGEDVMWVTEKIAKLNPLIATNTIQPQ